MRSRAARAPTAEQGGLGDRFRHFAHRAAEAVGSSPAFFAAVAVVVTSAASGRLFGFSDAWQLVINTGTTVVTFLMVFLIQNTQNRDPRAIQLKLDELIRALHGAPTRLIDLEDMDERELRSLQREFERIRRTRG